MTLRLRILSALANLCVNGLKNFMIRDISHFTDEENKGIKHVIHKDENKYSNHLPLLHLKTCLWTGERKNKVYGSSSTLRSHILFLLKGAQRTFKTAESGWAIQKGLGNNFRKHGTVSGFNQHLFPQQYVSLCLSFYPNCTQYKKLHYSGKVAFQARVHS